MYINELKRKYYLIIIHYNIFIKLIILLSLFNYTFQKIINNIIELGGEDFRYSHFSLNSKGDMVIDTSAYPGNNERRFFGLKKNGRPYFKDENNNETPFYSFFVSGLSNENLQKIEGESCFIQINSSKIEIHGNEYLLSFSKSDNYVELYDFENKEVLFEKTSFFFEPNISTDVGTFIKSNSKDSNSTYDYLISFTFKEETKYRFYVFRCNFNSKNITNRYNKLFSKKKTSTNRRIVSCFQTRLQKIVCLYQQNSDYKYIITVFDELNNSQANASLAVGTKSGDDIKVFYKGIHLKEEIGVFLYYIKCNDTYPRISFKIINSTNGIENYKGYTSIKINKKNFTPYALQNDIIKLNDNRICFIAPSYDKEDLNIVIFNLYNNDNNLSIRYFSINFFENYRYKFYLDLRAFSFNNFISVAFSHCPQSECSAITHLHYCSLIIFNYPNSTDEDYDLINNLYITNKKIENFSFNLEKEIKVEIENNIFGYNFEGIKIINYPENINLIYADNNSDIIKNKVLERNKNISIIFESNSFYKKNIYIIEYSAILKDNYESIDNLTENLDYKNDFNESEFFISEEFTGKTSYFKIVIKENLTKDCYNDSCYLCYDKNINYCIICKYNYSFNEEEKICFRESSFSTINSPTSFLELLNESSYLSTIITSTTPLNESFLLSTIPTTLLFSNKIYKSNSLSILPTTQNMITTNIIFTNTTLSKVYETSSIQKILKTSTLSTLYKKPIINSILSSTFKNNFSISTSLISSLSSNLLSEFQDISIPSIESRFESTSIYPFLKSTSFQEKFISIISSIILFPNSVNNSSYKEKIVQFKCSNDMILEGKCNDTITEEQINDIYIKIKNEYILNNKTNKTNNITIISTENVIIQVSTLEKEKDNNNKLNLSNIDLGECEKIIKEKEGLSDDDEIIIFKIDLKNKELTSTYVQYEIYNPYTNKKIDLDICFDYSIKINVPVNFDSNTEILYNSLNESGYNLFDLNDSFYTDICSTYTSINGTDVTLTDRKNIIYNNYANVSLCQDDCKFLYYNSNNSKITCACNAQLSEIKTDTNTLKFSNHIYENFLITLKNSNFFLMKCVKLVFSLKGQLNNI